MNLIISEIQNTSCLDLFQAQELHEQPSNKPFGDIQMYIIFFSCSNEET